MNSPKKITLNLRGKKHEVLTKELEKIPSTCRLAKLIDFLNNDSNDIESIEDKEKRLEAQSKFLLTICDDYDLKNNEFYFNRDPKFVNMILDYVNDRKLHIQDSNICIYKIFDELSYWNIDESMIEPCCLVDLYMRKNKMDNELDTRETILYPIQKDCIFEGVRFENLRKRIWNILEEPSSSIFAIIYLIFLFGMISMSTVHLILRTMPEYKKLSLFKYTETICIAWFTFEWFLRFLIYPKKIVFLLNPIHIADFISLVPFYIFVKLENSETLEIIKNLSRLFRTFTLFKIMKHSSSVHTLSLTLQKSYKEIGVYFLYLAMSILTFSCFVYYAENLEPDSKFESIPYTFWFAVVTLTTVGYGDIVPETTLGKILAGMCSITGVIVIALPVSLLSNNFSILYRENSERKHLQKLLKKTNPKRDLFFWLRKSKCCIK